MTTVVQAGFDPTVWWQCRAGAFRGANKLQKQAQQMVQ